MKSFTYYLTLLVIRMKGIKSEFSKDPLDYMRLRKADIHSFEHSGSRQFHIKDSLITEIGTGSSNRLIIYIHGGAFIYGPAKHHWDTAQKLAAESDSKLWMVDYPKAPENKIGVISYNIDSVFENALKLYGEHKIILTGDSVGGTLAIALTQRIIKNSAPPPSFVILICPVMDCSFQNDMIDSLDPHDPMLSKKGVLSAKKMCAENGNLDDPIISPINGEFQGFPKTLLCIAENDITSPDQEILVVKLKAALVDHKVIRGKGMPHIWPLLPVMKEAKMARKQMITEIKSTFH